MDAGLVHAGMTDLCAGAGAGMKNSITRARRVRTQGKEQSWQTCFGVGR